MRTSWPAVCAAVLIIGVFSSGCGAGQSAASAATQGASDAADKGDGVHEYRAVCTQKAAHDGNEYVLSKWLETPAKAKALGDYHSEFKYKGHSVRIEERVKPTRAPSQ